MPITDLSTEELKKMLTVNQIKDNLQNASASASKERTASREETRDAIWDFANKFKRGIREGFAINPLNKVPESDMNGSVLYDYKVQPQQIQQPVQTQIPVVQPTPQQVPQQTMKPVVPRQVVQRPTQKPVQPAPVQQQYVDPNMVTDMLNMYMQPDYQESVANSNPVAGETAIQGNEAYEQGVANAENNKSNVVADILNQIRTGYADNRDNGFAVENLQGDATKTGWNRFGEALGTTARMAGNPLVQGILAGAISGKINNDWGKGLEYGLQYAQNKAKSDAYEKMMGRRPSILGGYGTDDYKAYNDAEYKSGKLDIDKFKADYYAKNIESQIEQRAEKLEIDRAKLDEQIRHNKIGEKRLAAQLGISQQKAKAYINHVKWQEKNNGNMTPYQKTQVASQKYKNQLERIKNIEDKEVRNAAYEKAYQEYEDSLAFNADDDSDIWENED